MIGTLLSLAMLSQQAMLPNDEEPTPPIESVDAELIDDGSVDINDLDRIFVRDSSEATRVEVVHPLQLICVRKLMVGSRVKARSFCQDQTSWIAHAAALDAMIDSWANTGVPLEPGGDTTQNKSFGQGR